MKQWRNMKEWFAMFRNLWKSIDRLLAELLPGWAKGRALRRARRLARRPGPGEPRR